ncbi:MAG: hypothetical protein ACYTF7_04100 [Planctomycetota bacterium]|jgi:hypothetical protein
MRFSRALIVVGALVLGSVSSHAQFEQKLVPSNEADINADGAAGYSVAVDGDTAVLGSPGDGALAGASGSVYVFVRVGGVWSEEALISPPAPADDAEFGFDVDIDGDTLIVGAPGDELGFGGVYVYTRAGGVWTLEQHVQQSGADKELGDRFGASVSISGDSAIVGAPENSTNPSSHVGGAYVFVRSGSVWSEQQKLTPSDASVDTRFGTCVAIDGDTALVGDSATDSAYVFTRAGAAWSERTKLVPSGGGLSGDLYGAAVDLDAGTAIVGAPSYGAHGVGGAFVFVGSGASWSEQQALGASDGEGFDAFGIDVDLDGHIAMIGTDSGVFLDVGKAYAFERCVETWSEKEIFLSTDGAFGDQFGRGVGVSGLNGVVGAPGHDLTNADIGAGYVYRIDSCSTDLDDDGDTDGADLGLLLSNWGNPGAGDLNCDGTTDGADIGLLLASWGACV